ncbi:hypothetical protein D5S17_04710 [Pseudonocardiaceae bacterium YIM PH 21723]|nr:hypothetical protein D5S17_04710 [Pseudonocardiaceae bacterium YIM PH 21723]
MTWLFVQTLMLCLLAFALGALSAGLLLVRPLLRQMQPAEPPLVIQALPMQASASEASPDGLPVH